MKFNIFLVLLLYMSRISYAHNLVVSNFYIRGPEEFLAFLGLIIYGLTCQGPFTSNDTAHYYLYFLSKSRRDTDFM